MSMRIRVHVHGVCAPCLSRPQGMGMHMVHIRMAGFGHRPLPTLVPQPPHRRLPLM